MKRRAFPMLFYAITGIGIGIPVTLTCMTLIGGLNEVIQEFLVWTVASALFGMISGLIFGNEDKLNLPLAIVLHCAGCFVIAMGAVILCGYTESFIAGAVKVLPVFVIVYVLVYAFCFLNMKLQEKKINQTLNKS